MCMECFHAITSHQGTTPEEQAAGVLATDDRTPCRVDDALYLGSMMAALNNKALAEAGVTHVINCALGIEKQWPKFKPTYEATYLQLGWNDDKEQRLEDGLRVAHDFIEQCHQAGGVCFVHCAQGVSRSAAVVVYYVMRKRGLGFADALEFVRRGRIVAAPNESFVKQLKLLE